MVGEINCNCDKDYHHEDPIYARNHAPNRVVLGIIAKDGCMAEYVNLPVRRPCQNTCVPASAYHCGGTPPNPLPCFYTTHLLLEKPIASHTSTNSSGAAGMSPCCIAFSGVAIT